MAEFQRQFRRKDTLDTINEKFRACEQSERETIEQYGERVQQLVYNNEKVAQEQYGMTEFKHVDHLALSTFLKGLLDDKVREQVSLSNPDRIDEAIKRAVTATGVMKFVKRCELCRGHGHVFTECKMLSLTQLVCQLCSGVGHAASNCVRIKDQTLCSMCNQPGHVAID